MNMGAADSSYCTAPQKQEAGKEFIELFQKWTRAGHGTYSTLKYSLGMSAQGQDVFLSH